MLASAIRSVVGEAPVRVGKVKLDIPPLVENGNTVPMSVTVESPMTATDYVKTIYVFNEKNPQPNVVGSFIPRAARRSRPTSRRGYGSRTLQTIVVAIARADRRLVLVGDTATTWW